MSSSNLQKYTLQVSYENEIRKINVNNTTKIVEFIKKSLDIFDLNIDDIAGIYYYFVDAYVYLGDSDENSLDKTLSSFFEEYGYPTDLQHFTIEPVSLSRRSVSDIRQFVEDYTNFNKPESGNNSTYFYRPTINITNNYNQPSSQSAPLSYPIDLVFDYFPQTRNFENRGVSNLSNLFNMFGRSSQDTPNSSTNQQRQTSSTTQQRQTSSTNHQRQSTNQSASERQPESPQNNGNSYRSYFNNIAGSNYDAILSSLTGFLQESDQRVLRQSEINNLSRGTYSELKNNNLILSECTQCNITLEDFADDTPVIALPCKHAFKEQAITNWLRNNSNKCPVCRGVVAPGMSIYLGNYY